MDVITRAAAKAAGLKRYYTGKPCKHGHVAERSTVNGLCFGCGVDIRKRVYNKDITKSRKRGRDKARQRRIDNPEAVRAHDRNRPDRKTPEAKAKKRAYWKINAATFSQRRRTVYASNKGENRARGRARYAADPEYFKVYGKVRKGRVRGASGRFTLDDIKRIFALQRGRCANPSCKKSIKKCYDVDHIMPISLGGSNWPRNLQLLCPPCNNWKRAKHPIDFAQANGLLI